MKTRSLSLIVGLSVFGLSVFGLPVIGLSVLGPVCSGIGLPGSSPFGAAVCQAQTLCLNPSRVEVLPVFFVPQGGANPVPTQETNLMLYLSWAQARYEEMLQFRSTFALADSVPHVYTGIHEDPYYRSQGDGGAAAYTDELLTHYGYSRFDCPFVFLVIYLSPYSAFPGGGGRPINAGFNTGGGIVILSSYDLDHTPSFEATLQHELGHSFGLPHVDVYGYDMATNPSIMSYNPAHHTNFFRPSPTPGILIPEDLRGLALNKYVFPEMYFDPAVDIPAGYRISPDVVYLGIFDIPNQADYRLQVTTVSGEAAGSHVRNIVQHRIRPSVPGELAFDPATMWQSGPAVWAVAEVHFPFAVTMDRIGVHSQHSGQYHEADSLRVAIRDGGGYTLVTELDLDGVDQYVSFEAASDSVWAFSFRTGASGSVVIRGLEFFFEDETLFPPLVPYAYESPFLDQLPSRPELTSPGDGFEATAPTVSLEWTGLQADDYRLQVATDIDFCSLLLNLVLAGAGHDFTIPYGGATYYWRVKGRNEAGCGFGNWSEIRTFDSGVLQATDAAAPASRPVLYPNPATGSVTVRGEWPAGSATLRVLDAAGRLVYTDAVAGGMERTIRPNLAAGVYFVVVGDGPGQRTQKLVFE